MEEKLGMCPMSQSNVVDLMREKDCMCLGLAIKRSEAVINDPSKLIIEQVHPVYMSMDSFLESAIFNLNMNKDAAGNFDIKDESGKLAVGAGREQLTGLMPLFLFNEHWELAKRKAQPLYGFMCTLEPLGYTSTQFFTIPFLVLIKALQQNLNKPSEAMAQVVELVQQTCMNIIATNTQFQQQIVEKFTQFVAAPQNRTADVVSEIDVLAAQVWCLSKLSAKQRKTKVSDPQSAP